MDISINISFQQKVQSRPAVTIFMYFTIWQKKKLGLLVRFLLDQPKINHFDLGDTNSDQHVMATLCLIIKLTYF